ncbi:MAG: hypothetical protein RL208_67 [Pseudomonadota bacterium]|jgi:large subunit ribosomal protein L15
MFSSILSNFTRCVKDPIRVGRGVGSGKGRTAGRGHKGHKARSGCSGIRGFEGGQTPIFRRLPKRGFVKHDKSHYEIGLSKLIFFANNGLFSAQDVSVDVLILSGIIPAYCKSVKIINDGFDSSVAFSSLRSFGHHITFSSSVLNYLVKNDIVLNSIDKNC